MDTGPGRRERNIEPALSGQSLKKKSAIRAKIQETLQLDGEPPKRQSKKDSKS